MYTYFSLSVYAKNILPTVSESFENTKYKLTWKLTVKFLFLLSFHLFRIQIIKLLMQLLLSSNQIIRIFFRWLLSAVESS
jgi:hypothetical protein